MVGPARFKGLQRAFTLEVREKDHESIAVTAIYSCSGLTLSSCRSRPQDTLSMRTTTAAEQNAEQRPGTHLRGLVVMGWRDAERTQVAQSGANKAQIAHCVEDGARGA